VSFHRKCRGGFQVLGRADLPAPPVKHPVRAATRLLREAKVDLVMVAALLGHSSIAAIQIYTQPSEGNEAAAATAR